MLQSRVATAQGCEILYSRCNSALVSVVAVVRCCLYDAHVSYKRMKRKNEVNRKYRTGSPQPLNT